MSNNLIKLFSPVYTTTPSYTTQQWVAPTTKVVFTNTYTVSTAAQLANNLPPTATITTGSSGMQAGVPQTSNSFFASPIPKGFNGVQQKALVGTVNMGIVSFVVVPTPVPVQVATTVAVPGYSATITHPPVTKTTFNPNLGWDASAVSINQFSGNGQVRFSVPATVSGVTAGLNELSSNVGVNYTELQYAIYFSKGNYRVIELGQFKTTALAFTSTDVATITRLNGTVYYAINGVIVYQSLSPSTGAMLLDTSLYHGGDSLFDVAILNHVSQLKTPALLTGVDASFKKLTANLSSGFNTLINATLPAFSVTMLSAESGFAVLSASLPKMTAISFAGYSTVISATLPRLTANSNASTDSGINAQLPKLIGLASNRAYAGIIVSLPKLKAYASIGGLVPVGSTYIAAEMSAMTCSISGVMRNGNLPTLMQLPKLQCFMADRAYAEIQATLPSLSAFSGDYPDIANSFTGCAAIFTGARSGSGTLLWDGRTILTSAHVVYDLVAATYANVNIFFHSDANIPLPVVVDVVVHPLYVYAPGNISEYDLAIIVLRDTVPDVIQRYSLYDRGDEVDRQFERLGYSPVVNPSTGQLFPFYEWHRFSNRYDAYVNPFIPPTLLTQGVPTPEFTQLLYDYDNGTIARDVGGYYFGKHNLGIVNEGGSRVGDSGSAGFVKGLIAGICRSNGSVAPFDVTANPDGSYGELDSDIRVLTFIPWIQATVARLVTPFYAEATFPTLTNQGTLEEVPSFSQLTLLPGLTADARMEYGMSGRTTLPGLVLDAGLYSAPTLSGNTILPGLQAVGTLDAQGDLSQSVTFPKLSNQALLVMANEASGRTVFPALQTQLTLTIPPVLYGTTTFPVLTTDAILTTGMEQATTLPVLTLVAKLVAPDDLSGSVTLPGLTAIGLADTGMFGEATLPGLSFQGQIVPSSALNAVTTFPVLTAFGRMGTPIAMYSVVTLPNLINIASANDTMYANTVLPLLITRASLNPITCTTRYL